MKILKKLKFYLIGAVVTTLLLLTYFPQQVVGNSMTPTFVDGQLITISKLKVYMKGVTNNDIIVLKDVVEHHRSIKRVIAKEGDSLRIYNGQTYLNGQALEERYLLEQKYDTPTEIDTIVPKDSYFVMGDNRNHSLDSRNNMGFVNRKDILGIVNK